jgi:hypothetical protein
MLNYLSIRKKLVVPKTLCPPQTFQKSVNFSQAEKTFKLFHFYKKTIETT